MASADARNDDINRLNATWHIVETIDFQRSRLLLPKRVSHTLAPPDAILPYLRNADFGNMVQLKNFVFGNSLIIAFVKCWRLETNIFHLPWGECKTLRTILGYTLTESQ
ncbi:uncharacterized protein LOC130969886 [Arachis stenosperma]|uniref:uncharacterized protein LOC130969886 n=1 Tax=Arachis stenosperma TaxID=217475 RepID=UPI0025AD20D5|nr:uncharacterized protein LOC130969886 [Arachis stenosperma]